MSHRHTTAIIEERKAEKKVGILLQTTAALRYSHEVHADIIIDGVDDSDDGTAKPYMVSIERGSYRVLAIRRNWNPDDALMLKRQHFVHCVYPPGFGFYGLGLIHIIGGYAQAGTSDYTSACRCRCFGKPPRELRDPGFACQGGRYTD